MKPEPLTQSYTKRAVREATKKEAYETDAPNTPKKIDKVKV